MRRHQHHQLTMQTTFQMTNEEKAQSEDSEMFEQACANTADVLLSMQWIDTHIAHDLIRQLDRLRKHGSRVTTFSNIWTHLDNSRKSKQYERNRVMIWLAEWLTYPTIHSPSL
jgi:ribonuclease HI